MTAAMIGLSQSKRLVSPAKPPLSQPRLPPGGLPFQVVAGAERLVAGAGDDRDPLLGIGGEVVEHLVELEMRVDMQRIVNLGPRQRHDGDGTLARHLGEFQIHVCSRRFSAAKNMADILPPAPRSAPSNYATRPRVQASSACLTWRRASHLNRSERACAIAPKRKTRINNIFGSDRLGFQPAG
ncbi:hypothetical protein ACVWY2_009387 [Bradyrhizobium sp. JR6.1]